MNPETAAVVEAILADWGEDLPELIAEWRAEGEDFIPQSADQLHEDLEESWSSWQDDPDGRLLTLGCMLLLDRVDWVAVAQQLWHTLRTQFHNPSSLKGTAHDHRERNDHRPDGWRPITVRSRSFDQMPVRLARRRRI